MENFPVTYFTRNASDDVRKAARELRFKHNVTITANSEGFPSEYIQIIADNMLSSSQMTEAISKGSEEVKQQARIIRFRKN